VVNEKELINSVDRALDILLLLQDKGKEMGITEISNALGVYKSTIYRTLVTLENKGFVQQNSENGKYWLGLRLYSLGMLIKDKLTIKNLVYPYAKALAEKFKEVVHISILDQNAQDYPKHIIIEKCESQQVLSLTPPRSLVQVLAVILLLLERLFWHIVKGVIWTNISVMNFRNLRRRPSPVGKSY